MRSHISTPIPENVRNHILVVGYDGHSLAQYICAFRKLQPDVSGGGGFTYVYSIGRRPAHPMSIEMKTLLCCCRHHMYFLYTILH